MKKLSLILLSFCLLIALPTSAWAAPHIFACAPEWGALAKAIGGDKVTIHTATHAREDTHHIRAKPSLLIAMRQADMVICSGAALEIEWLPILLYKSGRPDVQQGSIGSIMVSDYVPLLDVMHEIDDSMGHVHPEGNPHTHLDPNNILIMSEVIADRLSDIDAENTQFYQNRKHTFHENWEKNIAKWNEEARDLKGQKIIAYHKSWAYLLNWLGMDMIASLESKPGNPPNAAHLEKTLQKVKGQNVKGILVAPFENKQPAYWLSQKLNIPVINLPFTVNGNDESRDLKMLFDDTIKRLKTP